MAAGAAVPPILQRPPGGAKAAVAAAAGSRGWFCVRAVVLVFLSKAEERFCRVRQPCSERCPVAVRQCLGMVDPALAGIRSREHTKREWAGGRKKKPTKVSLQVLNFTLSRSNHFAKYKHIFSHIQTAKYSIIFTFRYSA